MSPGPVSDSYDPEFGTGANAAEVREAIEAQIRAISKQAGLRSRKPILNVVRGRAGKWSTVSLQNQDWRVIRFALYRALESL